MSKKTKAAKRLPSALTVASSAQPNARTPQAPLATAKSSEAEVVKPSASSVKPQPRSTSGRIPAPPSAPPAAAPSSPKAPRSERAPSPKPCPTVRVRFELLEPQAKKVSLCGGFNAWSPGATPMNRQKDGLWETSLALPPGRHEYKFVVDGQWLPDPNAQENVFNAHGTLNSVLVVRG